MTRSRKRPYKRIIQGDTKKEKQIASRKFRRQEHTMIQKEEYELLPYLGRHVVNPWDILDIAPIYQPEEFSAYRK